MPSDSPEPISKILVPIANPATAENLLRMACAFLGRDDSKVIALCVLLGELEKEATLLTDLEAVVQHLHEEGCPLELQTQNSSSVARGILDAARDTSAELIILGIRQPLMAKLF